MLSFEQMKKIWRMNEQYGGEFSHDKLIPESPPQFSRKSSKVDFFPSELRIIIRSLRNKEKKNGKLSKSDEQLLAKAQIQLKGIPFETPHRWRRRKSNEYLNQRILRRLAAKSEMFHKGLSSLR